MQKTASFRHFIHLLRYALRYRNLAFAQFALMGVSVGLGLLKPWPLKILVDNVVGEIPLAIGAWNVGFPPEILLVLACVAYLLFYAGDSLVQVGSTTVAALSSSRMIRDLRADLLRCLEGLSIQFHDSHKVGDLAHRVSYNTTAVETAFQSGFMGAVKSVIWLAGMFVVMMFMNVKLTLVALAIVPFLLITIRIYAKHIHQVSRRHQDQEGSVLARVQEILSSIRLVQAFTQEDREHDRFRELCDRSVQTRIKTTVVQNAFGFCVAAVMALGTALFFYLGILEVRNARLTIGEFLVFNAYLAMLYAPLSVLSYTTSSVQSALGGGARLFEILDSETRIKDRPGAKSLQNARGEIRCENVSFGYDPGNLILHDIAFSVEPGRILAIVGETGGGKSTLLHVLMRFYEPERGRICLDGEDIAQLTVQSLRENIALVPQDTLLFSDSIRENIAYGRPSADDKEIIEAAQMAEAHEFILQLPNAYDTLVGERGVRLSTGQRQRIALARAFLKNAPVILMDEPTSALDAETESRLLSNTLERIRKGRTLIIVAHRLSTIRMADRILVLNRGRVVETGAHEEMLAREGAYSRLWKAQQSERPAESGSAI